MTSASYIRALREKIGPDRLMIPSIAAIIRDDQGRLLLQRKSGSEGWSLPAGAIEIGEGPEDALRREVREETGLSVCSAILVAAFGGRLFRHTYPNGDEVEYIVIVYRCGVDGVAEAPTDPETIELRYFNERDAPALALPYPRTLLFD